MKIVLVGDSHTEIQFPYLKEELEKQGHQVLASISKRGWSSRSFLNNPDTLSDIPLIRPDAVIVALGGNNHRLDKNYKFDVMGLLDKVTWPKAKVIWLGPYTSQESKAPSTAQRHEWTADWLKNNLPPSVTFVDMRPVSTEGFEPDGVHFKASAYRRMTDEIMKQIQRGLPSPLVRFAKSKAFLPVVVPMALLVVTFIVGRMRSR